MNFTEYLTYTRIEKSKYLLCNSDKSILDIAVLIGFNSQSYFTTNFKKHTGVTPKEFREKNNIDYIF
jgi:AraC-like DNA-binding protein